ncbi:MAG: M18 family aminopeptidase [Clostridia bacterium]|nr:M18 family aminopeptidase [Clostridia bacterium]
MQLIEELSDFIKNCPSPFHTVQTVVNMLGSAGFEKLTNAPLTDGGKYYTVRNGTSVIAFVYRSEGRGFSVSAAHTDTPNFRVKSTSEKIAAGAYTVLETEKYGGSIYYTWLDRPLSVAGRVLVRTESGAKTRLISVDRDLLVIPSVAIHLNRAVNDGAKFNPAVDLLPLYSAKTATGGFSALIAKEACARPEDVISYDLSVFVRDGVRTFGDSDEFILSPRLDDLACVYSCLKGFLEAEPTGRIPVLALFDNEEVGSETKQGAASTFLSDTLSRIGGENLANLLSDSFSVSADNAHAKHPNHPEYSDPDHAPVLGGGVVIKYNMAQHYATDALSFALFSEILRKSDVPSQIYYNRADLPGGSTLGSISDTKVSIPTVDIGLPQLAMHSAVETGHRADVLAGVQAMKAYYSADFTVTDDGFTFLK